MNAQHTPGQWFAVGHWVEHESDDEPDICNCNPASMDQEGRDDDEICANARLIAAAPYMLEVLRECAQKFRLYENHYANKRDLVKESLNRDMATMCEVAISSATGGEE